MRVLIAAGGTAGHINPALAIAGALKKADPTAEIHFAGRKEGMEYRLVTQAGYPFHHIEITGFQRKLSLHNINRNTNHNSPFQDSARTPLSSIVHPKEPDQRKEPHGKES